MSGEPFACARCGTEGPRLSRPPFAGALGREIADRVCATCWSEWRSAEVMVINELRLNFMDPAAQETLAEQMKQFLALDFGPDR
jgi:Fe-S cluster biosynthesis and repair protein YggX